MHLSSRTPRDNQLSSGWLPAFLIASLALATAPCRANTPASKVFVSDVSGAAVIDTGEKIHDLNRQSVYNAEGTVIETKPSDPVSGSSKSYSTLVYSNGTGAYFDADTRVEVKRFAQESFTPTRTDFDVEPSISQTQAFVARGTVGLCTSKLVAGSSMVYETPLASVAILGRKVVIEAQGDETKISMLDGESTVRAGVLDAGGHTLRVGEQAVIRRGGPGQPNHFEIRKIPPADMPALDAKVTMACMAKRTVYFDVEPAATGSDAAANSAASGAAADTANPPGLVRAFYGNSAGSANPPAREIVAIPVVPANLPVPFVVSPANLAAPGR